MVFKPAACSFNSTGPKVFIKVMEEFVVFLKVTRSNPILSQPSLPILRMDPVRRIIRGKYDQMKT